MPEWAQHSGNYSYCQVNIDCLEKNNYFAHSAIDKEIESIKNSGISLIPKSSPFNTLNVNSDNIIDGTKAYDRICDTENKILSDIANSLGSNYDASGQITLYTYLKPCMSCDNVFYQFREMYPNIKIDVVYEKFY